MAKDTRSAWGNRMRAVWKLVHYYKERGVIKEANWSSFWERAQGWNWGFYDALKQAAAKKLT